MMDLTDNVPEKASGAGAVNPARCRTFPRKQPRGQSLPLAQLAVSSTSLLVLESQKARKEHTTRGEHRQAALLGMGTQLPAVAHWKFLVTPKPGL